MSGTPFTLDGLEDITITLHRNFTFTGTIASVVSGDERRSFTTSAITFPGSGTTPASGYFQHGNFLMTSGANKGVRRDIRTHDGNDFTLYLKFPKPLAVSDAWILEVGCDKADSTCETKFDNLVNFQGFPHMPAVSDVFGLPVSTNS